MKYFYLKANSQSRIMLYHKAMNNKNNDLGQKASFDDTDDIIGVDNYHVLLEYGLDLKNNARY